MTEHSNGPSGEINQKSLQEHLPELGGEVELAINALKNVQRITGALLEGSPPTLADFDPKTRIFSETVELTQTPKDHENAPAAVTDAASSEKNRILAAGQTFGRYQISRQLGQGAMGAVYLAYDPQLQRYVALKTPFLGDKPNVVQRFYREARSAAQIRSPYVCPIYEVNSVAGKLYLTMAYIEGRSLSKWIHKEQPHSMDEILEIFHKIASGMQKAHAQSVVHRDLKPDNIMVDSDGAPIIMDFGLALRTDDEVRATAAGHITGTPAYMSPEQVRGQPDEIGPQADVYSLGVVLYEMLTGVVPFRGQLMTVLNRLLHEPPAPPSSVQPSIPADSPIEKICLKMLAKEKSNRYASMSDVLSDVAPLLREAPVITKPVKPPRFQAIRKLFGRPVAATVDATVNLTRAVTD